MPPLFAVLPVKKKSGTVPRARCVPAYVPFAPFGCVCCSVRFWGCVRGSYPLRCACVLRRLCGSVRAVSHYAGKLYAFARARVLGLLRGSGRACGLYTVYNFVRRAFALFEPIPPACQHGHFGAG